MLKSSAMTPLELKKAHEEVVRKTMEDWTLARLLIAYQYLVVRGGGHAAIEHRIDAALREELKDAP